MGMNWKKELMDDFSAEIGVISVMFERATRDVEPIGWVERMEGFFETRIDLAYEEGRKEGGG